MNDGVKTHAGTAAEMTLGEDQTAKWRSAPRLLALMFALVTGIAASATESHAQSRLCRQLEAQLASASSGGPGSSAQARKYDEAIKRQRANLRKGERQYRGAGCGGGLFWRDSGGGSCEAIGRSLDRMERNLAQLERSRARMGGRGGDPRRERARLLAALDANDCRPVRRDRNAPEFAARQPRGNLFDQLFGGGIKRAEPREDEEFQAYDGSARVRTIIGGDGNMFEVLPGGGGSYRTLCVRTCDGYYWPISYSSSGSDFQRDEQNCQTMCPGTEVKLYSHRVPDEESENMVDLLGSPYTDLATAFKYREVDFVRPQGCSCTPAKKNFSVIAGAGAPPAKPTDGEDPSTAHASSQPDPAATEDPGGPAGVEAGGEGKAAERRVRVVGPAYLPDPEGAIDLRAPGPTAIQ
jgi:hypothetical protein